MDQEEIRIKDMVQELLDELFIALGFSPDGWISNLFSPLFQEPMYRFSSIATNFDELVIKRGFQEAANWFTNQFVKGVDALGVRAIPKEGPLLIASNHPGAYDSLLIAANIPRDDIKIISSPIRFLRMLPTTREHMVFSAPDAHVRMGVVRQAIRHLRAGGALLVFARGSIDPDPAHIPGAEDDLELWSPSLGLFLQKVPQLKLAITLVSGVLSHKYANHPFTIFRKRQIDKQRIAEFFQVMRQLLSPGELMITPKLTFAPPMTLKDFKNGEDVREITSEIVKRAKSLLPFHTGTALLPSHIGQEI